MLATSEDAAYLKKRGSNAFDDMASTSLSISPCLHPIRRKLQSWRPIADENDVRSSGVNVILAADELSSSTTATFWNP